jgi:hypothetical protein
MRVTFSKPLPAGLSADFEYGRDIFTRHDMLAWLRTSPRGGRYYVETPAYTAKTGRKVWGRRGSDGRRCLVDETRHVPAGGMFHNVPKPETLVKMRAEAEGRAALIKGDGTVLFAAVVAGKIVTRTGVAL